MVKVKKTIIDWSEDFRKIKKTIIVCGYKKRF